MNVVLIALGLIALPLIGCALWLAGIFLRRPPKDARHTQRKRQLFNAQAEELTIQSADNLRLLSEEQITELES